MKKLHITIPEPCHEKWSEMTPKDQGRFCQSCQKVVIDFSSMSDRQIAAYFKKPAGSLCGRFQADQLNREISETTKRLPWLKYFFQFSLPAFLLSAKAQAQGQTKVVSHQSCSPADTVTVKNPDGTGEKKLVEGKVFDSYNKPVVYASVMIVGTNQGVMTDTSGSYRLSAPVDATLEITAVGFESQRISVREYSGAAVVTQMASMELSGMVGGIVYVRTTKKRNRSIPLVTKTVDTAFRHFSVYPNPVSAHSIMKIDCSRMQKGEYVLSVIDMKGQVVQTSNITLGKKGQVEFLLEDVQAGTYVLQLFSHKTAASVSEKIIVQ